MRATLFKLSGCHLRQSRSYLAGRGTAAEAAQAILPRAFHTFNEFFVTCLDTLFTVIIFILVSHGSYLVYFRCPQTGLVKGSLFSGGDRITG